MAQSVSYGAATQPTATGAIGWLMRESTGSASPSMLLGELCNKLLELEGLPISTAILTIAGLDPMVSLTRLRWHRQSGRVVEEILLHGMTRAEESPAPDSLHFTLPGTTYQIEWHAESHAGFALRERDYLAEVCVAMAAPMQVVVERNITRRLLQTYLGRRCADKVLTGAVRRGIGEVVEAVIWLSDLRDFTSLSETLPPDQIIMALNDCCARLVGAIQPFGGEVLKFMGDGLLAIFPLATHGDAAACDAAIAAVRSAREGMTRLDGERLRLGLPALPFGVGLHLGAVVYGNIGAPDRLDFTAIGPAVNLASRIERLCRPLGCPVLISEEVTRRSTANLATMGRHSLRGSAQSIELFTLREFAPEQSNH
jgi:adenylate cyclase